MRRTSDPVQDARGFFCRSSSEEEAEAGRGGQRFQARGDKVQGRPNLPGGEENGPQPKKLSDPAGPVQRFHCGRLAQVGQTACFRT